MPLKIGQRTLLLEASKNLKQSLVETATQQPNLWHYIYM